MRQSHWGEFAAAMAAGLAGGASLVYCEKRRDTNVQDPKAPYGSKYEEPEVQATSPSSSSDVSPSVVSLDLGKHQQMLDEAVATSPRSRSGGVVDETKLEMASRNAKKHTGGLKVFSGNGNMALAREIVHHLKTNLGAATVGRHADGEVNVVIHENVRGKDTYIVQPTCPPVNDNLIELLLMVSCLNRASAKHVTAVIPYYGYARQDRKLQVRVVAVKGLTASANEMVLLVIINLLLLTRFLFNI